MRNSDDRYAIRPATSAPDRWDVWDTMRDAPVYVGKDMTEDRARLMAQRLSDIYRDLHPRT